jgi:hypothetical protein
MVVVTLGLTLAAVLVLALVTRVLARGRRNRDGSGDRSVTGRDR